MNIAVTRPSAPPRAVLALAWLGLCTGLATCALSALHARTAHYAAFGPQDLSAWAAAIGGAISALSTGASAAIIAWTKVVPVVLRGVRSLRRRRHRGPRRPHGTPPIAPA